MDVAVEQDHHMLPGDIESLHTLHIRIMHAIHHEQSVEVQKVDIDHAPFVKAPVGMHAN